uniref:Uncharacterized protein n=1 Tax=Schizaphis graminum TaxID=13262 RepID=A0A2S2NDA4_SCHGA
MNLILNKQRTPLNDVFTMYNLTAVFFYYFINTLGFVHRNAENEFGFPIVNVPREKQMQPNLNDTEEMWETDDDLLIIGEDDDDDEENMSEVYSPDIMDFND